ncbi:MAG: AraC family transcriptional regulator ligand-binding domain-containing protein [Candidatus Binatia bacterium]
MPFGAKEILPMPSRATAHNPVTLLHIPNYLRGQGISPVEIFRQADISPSMLLDANGWIPRDLCFLLGEQVTAVVDDRFPGAKIGQLYRLTELGAWGNAVIAAPDLEQACAVAANGIGLLHGGSDLRFLRFRRHAQLRFSFRGKLPTNPVQHLLSCLVILRKIATLAGAPEAVSVQLSMPYTRDAEQLEETHGPALEFGCTHDAIVIDREIMNQPLSDAVGNNNAVEPAETAAAIGALVKQFLLHGNVTIENIAARQRLSVRTLQRRLREWGFSFEEIVDDVRRTEAIRHVQAGENSAMEIAFLLGYSDQSHFTRAFKRWTGLSPRQYANTYR